MLCTSGNSLHIETAIFSRQPMRNYDSDGCPTPQGVVAVEAVHGPLLGGDADAEQSRAAWIFIASPLPRNRWITLFGLCVAFKYWRIFFLHLNSVCCQVAWRLLLSCILLPVSSPGELSVIVCIRYWIFPDVCTTSPVTMVPCNSGAFETISWATAAMRNRAFKSSATHGSYFRTWRKFVNLLRCTSVCVDIFDTRIAFSVQPQSIFGWSRSNDDAFLFCRLFGNYYSIWKYAVVEVNSAFGFFAVLYLIGAISRLHVTVGRFTVNGYSIFIIFDHLLRLLCTRS